jgi:L-amino acid N-acyltransferase YncA
MTGTKWKSLDAGAGIRPATVLDIPAITSIYAHHVKHGLATFEEVPPDETEMATRFEEISGRKLPYFVAILDGEPVGFAYASSYRTRSAYRFTLEDSVYLKSDATGRGLGKLLLSRVIEEATSLGFRQIIAVIGDSAHRPSIRLHEALAFKHAGLLSAVGFKHSRWVDTVLMQRALGDGDVTLPKELR